MQIKKINLSQNCNCLDFYFNLRKLTQDDDYNVGRFIANSIFLRQHVNGFKSNPKKILRILDIIQPKFTLNNVTTKLHIPLLESIINTLIRSVNIKPDLAE